MSAPQWEAECSWPPLPSPYREALHAAVAFILERFEDVLGIVATGTIVRGNPAPTSDLDLYVVCQQLRRQRLQRPFHGVPAEIFVNPARQIALYLAEERRAARPITAHMLATGFVVLARGPEIAQLREAAQRALTLRPDWDVQTLTYARYNAATRYEDATDVAAERPETATMMLNLAVYDMVHYHFLRANRYLPRDKDLLEALADLDPALAATVRAFYAATTHAERLVLAAHIADSTIATRGFFAWESAPEVLVL